MTSHAIFIRLVTYFGEEYLSAIEHTLVEFLKCILAVFFGSKLHDSKNGNHKSKLACENELLGYFSRAITCQPKQDQIYYDTTNTTNAKA